MDGYYTQSQFHNFISILLERSPRFPLLLSTFHASHSLLLRSIARLTALVLFYFIIIYLFYLLFIFSRVLLARCIHASPRFPFATSPFRLSPVSTYH